MKKRRRRLDKRLSLQPQSRAKPLTARAILSTDLRCCLVIFGFAFIVRLVYLLQIESIPLFYHLAGDARSYDEWAQRIVAGDWYGEGVFYQAPLYPYFLALLEGILGHDLWRIRLFQIALGALSCAGIFIAGKALFSRTAGIAAALILACYGPAIFFEGLIEKSIVDLVCVVALLVLLLKFRDKQTPVKLVAIGAVSSLLGLSRENALVLAIVIPVWIVFYFSQQSVQHRLGLTALFFAGLFIILLPVGLRNLNAGGEFRLTTSQFGPNFFIGNNPAADGTYASVRSIIAEPHLEGRDAKRLAERALGRSLTAGEVSHYWSAQAWNYIKSQPLTWLTLLGKKWLIVWNAREIEDSDDFYIYQQWSWLLRSLGSINHFGVLVPLAAMGVFLTRHQWRRLWLLYAMVLSFAVSIAIFYIFGRYRFPLVPLLVLFAGAGVVSLKALVDRKDRRGVIAAIAALLITAVVVNWPTSLVRRPGPGGYNNLANAFYKQGKIDEAIETARKAVQTQPNYGVAHYNLGNLYAANKRFDLAEHHLNEAIRLYPNYAEARSNLGQLLAERGDLDGGIQQFRKAIELNPSLSRAHLNLGIALAKQSQVEEAKSALRRAVSLAPDSAEAHYALGTVYAAEGLYEDSIKHFKEVVRIQWDFAQAHQSLAQVLALQGKREEAIQHHQQALKLMKQRAFGGPSH